MTYKSIREAVEALAKCGVTDRSDVRRVVENIDRHAGYEGVGGAAFWELSSNRDDEQLHDLPGWPECECASGCSEPATTTDDSSTPVCGGCSEYVVDEEGDVHCASCDGDVEVTTDSWGHSVVVLSKPEEVSQVEAGAVVRFRNPYGCDRDWSVVEYYSTLEDAKRAAAYHSDGFHRRHPNGYGPEWDAQAVEDAEIDTADDMRDRMDALVADDGPIDVLNMDGYSVAHFASRDDAEEWIRLESAIFHLRQGNNNAYLPRSIVRAGVAVRRAGQYSTTWVEA